MKHDNKEFLALTKKLNWSIEWTCKQLNVSRGTVCLWCNGEVAAHEQALKIMRGLAHDDHSPQEN